VSLFHRIWDATGSVSRRSTDVLDHPLIIQTIRRDPSRSVWIDEASNLSRPDPSGADRIDAEHQATDLALEPAVASGPQACPGHAVWLTRAAWPRQRHGRRDDREKELPWPRTSLARPGAATTTTDRANDLPNPWAAPPGKRPGRTCLPTRIGCWQRSIGSAVARPVRLSHCVGRRVSIIVESNSVRIQPPLFRSGIWQKLQTQHMN
jgi:hypothetical protein